MHGKQGVDGVNALVELSTLDRKSNKVVPHLPVVFVDLKSLFATCKSLFEVAHSLVAA